ncbi:phosphoribosylglycinamide formyltransferase [Candidatus Omnitrophota bacterium]
MKRLAIFVSGSGTNMENIVKAARARTIKRAEVALVVSDNPKAFALKRCDRLKVPSIVVYRKNFEDKDAFEKAILRELRADDIDFIVLAGYMRIIGPKILKEYKNKILNIHPALLPSFPGAHGIKDAFKAGVKVTGVSVHIVDAGVDTGPIVLQQALEVKKNETLESLEKRIHKIEYELYPQAIQLMVDGKIKINKGKITVLS